MQLFIIGFIYLCICLVIDAFLHSSPERQCMSRYVHHSASVVCFNKSIIMPSLCVGHKILIYASAVYQLWM